MKWHNKGKKRLDKSLHWVMLCFYTGFGKTREPLAEKMKR